MQDRFEDLRTFVALAETRSFGAAGRRLGIAKSAVSRRLHELEDRLATRLVNRTTRRLSLTEAGTELLQRSVRLLEELYETEASISGNRLKPVGRLRVTGPMSFGILHLSPVICEFLTLYEGLDVELNLDDRLVDIVGQGYDLAVRISWMKDSSLVAKRIAPIRHVLCASSSYLENFGVPKTPADLSKHRGISYSGAERMNWQFRDPHTGALRIAQIPCPITVNNGDAVREMAIGGYGICAIPSFIVHRAVAAGQLQVVLSRFQPPPIWLHALYPSRKHVPSKVRVFIQFLEGRFGKNPYWDRDIDAAAPTKEQ